MHPGHSRYLSRRRPRARPFLRTARLNVVGWSALAGVGLVAAAVSVLLLRSTQWPEALRAAVGPVGVLVVLMGADRRKWGRMETGFSFSDDPAEVHRVGGQLVERGLPVRVEDEGWGPALRYRNRDAARVRAALAELGIRTF